MEGILEGNSRIFKGNSRIFMGNSRIFEGNSRKSKRLIENEQKRRFGTKLLYMYEKQWS
jgi:hypothetical protein